MCFKTLKCCGLFDLRTAGKIIGWMGIVLQIIFLVYAYFIGTTLIPTLESIEANVIYGIVTVVLVIAGINLVTNGLLIMGSSYGKPSFIQPFLIYDMIAIVLHTLSVVSMIKMFDSSLIPGLVVTIFYVVLKIYLWNVVHSLRISLIRPPPNTQAVRIVYTQPRKVYTQPPQQQSV